MITTNYLREIRDQQFVVTWAATYDEGLAHLSERHFDLCFFDYWLGAHTGLDLLSIAQAIARQKLAKGGAFVDVKAAFDAQALQDAGFRVWRL